MRLDPNTGELIGDGPECPRCASYEAQTEAACADLEHAERELRRLRRVNAQLDAELKRQRQESAEGKVAKALFRYWLARCEKDPKRTKFGDKREKVVVARLRQGFDAQFIARAIDGCAVGAYTNPSNGVRYDDLELICRDEVKLERFHQLAERVNAPTLVGPAWLAEFGVIEPEGEDEKGEPTPY